MALSPSEQAAVDTARAVHDLGASFMLDMDTYVNAASAGYQGMAFYFAGRGGVLGDVSADDVFDAFHFFPRETVASNWDSSADVESRSSAAQRFAEAAHTWSASHLPESGIDYSRLAELAAKIVDAADGSGAPVFDGWRKLDSPSDARANAVHQVNALRELRAARHGAAVAEVSLAPRDAFMIKTPYMASVFGWPEPESAPDDESKALWEAAERLTNVKFGADLGSLDDVELTEFCDLVNAALAAMT